MSSPLNKAASLSELLKAGATVEQCQLTARVFDVLADISERLAKIEHADAVREATKSFAFGEPVNGAMHTMPDLGSMTLDEIKALFAGFDGGSLHAETN